MYGMVVRGLRRITQKTVDDEPRWRVRGDQLLTGYVPAGDLLTGDKKGAQLGKGR
jgi:hypothetical protein